MSHIVRRDDADVFITGTDAGKNKIRVEMKDERAFISRKQWETEYPVELIEKILAVKGPRYLCDEIMRDEWRGGVERRISHDIFGYVGKEAFASKRALDFGSGSAGSTMVLARLLPDTEIVGVDLQQKLVDIAELRAAHYRVADRVTFCVSPDSSRLPADIGQFDFVFLNAVYEHLLPDERRTLLSILWGHMKPGGILFINQTPYRWFPVESHTTSGLVFINYLPARAAAWYARRFSKRNLQDDDWQKLLRKGIRGGSVREILGILRSESHKPVLLNPEQDGLKDRIDLWYAASSKSRFLFLKKGFFFVGKLIKAVTGVTLLPTLSLAVQKSAQ